MSWGFLRFEEEIEDAVDGGHVDGDEEEDRLQHEHGEGTQQVFRQDLADVDAVLVERGVDGPVACLEAEFLGAPLEDHRGEGLRDDEEAQHSEERDHD